HRRDDCVPAAGLRVARMVSERRWLRVGVAVKALVQRSPGRLVLAGLSAAAFGLLDPRLLAVALVGAGLALVGLVLGAGHPEGRTRARLAAALAVVYAAVAWTGPDFAADSPSYYVYLRSAAFDHDLQFANEWQEWGYPEQPVTVTGHRLN